MSGPKERYPGMRELAEKIFSSTPAELHGLVSRKMKFYLDVAKSQGVATTMDWAQQSLKRLKDKFGPVPESMSKVEPSAATVTPKKIPKPATAPRTSLPQFRDDSHTPNAAIARETLLTPKVEATKKTALSGAVQPITPTQLTPVHSAQPNPKLTTPQGAPSTPKTTTSATPAGSQSNGRKKRALSGTLGDTPSGRKKQNTSDPITARQMRFQSSASSKQPTPSPYVDHQLTQTVVGTFQELEKPYFRLTGQVNPAVVRPPHILERSLSHVLSKYENDKTNYAYISEQLQSIRQDLTVQHVETKLTLRVYETNARVALFHNDIGEFNKCLTRVLQLHEQLPGKIKSKNEFRAYSLYYMLLLKRWSDISTVMKDSSKNRIGEATDLFGKAPTPLENTGEEYPRAPSKQQEMFKRSLMCAHCVQIRDLHLLEAHSRAAWPLEMNLLKLILERERVAALEAIFIATYQQKQSLTIATIGTLLGLVETDNAKSILEAWSVPISHDGTVSSEEALPVIQQKLVMFGKRFDIKGQK